MRNALLLSLLFTFQTQAATFYEVPEVCQQLLSEVADLAEVVDWRPWSNHLRELGYAEVMVRHIMQRAGDALGGTAFLHNLMSWGSRREPRGATGVAEFFEGPGGRRLYHVDAKFLMQRVPFWLDQEDRLGLARRTIPTLFDPDVTRAMLAMEARLGDSARAAIRGALIAHVERRLEDSRRPTSQLLLHTLAVVPWEDLSETVREFVTREWVDLKTFAPWRTDRVRPRGFGLVEAGNCEHMSDGHLRLTGVIPNEMHERPQRYVRVNGTLVGVIKGEPYGQPSMIALRNVMDERGRLVLALGAAYELPYEIITARGSQIVDVETLAVGPVDFILNGNAWKSTTAGALLSWRERPNPEDVNGAHDMRPVWAQIQATHHRRVHAEVLRRLTHYLVETEASLPPR